MMEFTLKNGMKIIYIKRESNITSMCFGLEAGAFAEKEDEIGIAHALEHLLYKETETMTEDDINKRMSRIFGMTNAMTNFPYVIYYGSCLKEDTEEAFLIFSEVLRKPTLRKEHLYDEVKVINEELNEWKDDPYQYCEDKLYFNAYEKARLKYPIIGEKQHIDKFNIEKLREFYNRNYTPDNCVLGIVSNHSFQSILDIMEGYFGDWENPIKKSRKPYKISEHNKNLKSIDKKKGLSGVKIEYLFKINNLSKYDKKALRIFNEIFGATGNGIIYDEIRTKSGLAYDVSSRLVFDKGIEHLLIKVGTSKGNEDEVIKKLNECIERVKENKYKISHLDIKNVMKTIELKNALDNEMSLRLCIRHTINEIMFNDHKSVERIFDEKDEFTVEFINDLVKRVLDKPTIQVITD
ncbi:pitrilysin family protein [Clostridium sediminicola]|uniref:M16 family metallopeptidase n=1 Tax=Clostridium sediminicola TaxID=3114879 RepID=UPI0031F205B3